jgi:hypothetical protein
MNRPSFWCDPNFETVYICYGNERTIMFRDKPLFTYEQFSKMTGIERLFHMDLENPLCRCFEWSTLLVSLNLLEECGAIFLGWL